MDFLASLQAPTLSPILYFINPLRKKFLKSEALAFVARSSRVMGHRPQLSPVSGGDRRGPRNERHTFAGQGPHRES